MHIFIMRHGEAQSLMRSDRERKLTEFGRQQAQASGLWLKRNYFATSPIDYALVSPYQRASETFDLVSDEVTVKHCEYSDDVVPSGQPLLVTDYLLHLLTDVVSPYKSILIVSHMPFVSYLVDEICAQHHSILFPTAAIAAIEFDAEAHKGRVVEHFHPA